MAPTTTPTFTSTPSPTATFTPTLVLARIAFTGGKWIYLRETPGGRIILALPEGAQVQILYPRENIDGQEWIEVQTPFGVIGWILKNFLMVYP